MHLFFSSFLIPLGVVVATDDEKIAECCRGFGADVIMTSESCRNGEIFGCYCCCDVDLLGE